MILLIDNYDSFVYNLARYFEEIGHETHVVRNDKITLSEIVDLNPNAIVLSPGPCGPDQAGICLDVVRTFGGRYPILGVCLGHQVIAKAFGDTIKHAGKPTHGKASLIDHCQQGLFDGLASPLQVGRYHSLSVSLKETSPLKVAARSRDGEIMAFSHEGMKIHGVQFHPESVLTHDGHTLLRNFLKLCSESPNESLV